MGQRAAHNSCYIAISAIVLSAVCILSACNSSDQGLENSSRAEFETRYTLAQIAEHNKPDDCWLAVEGRVYNITTYIPKHPGGTPNIIGYCGSESTGAYKTKGGIGRNHSLQARKLLERYVIGRLE